MRKKGDERDEKEEEVPDGRKRRQMGGKGSGKEVDEEREGFKLSG